MIQYKEKLYIKDQLGKVREWYIHYDETKYVKHYGVLNGETITSITEVKEGKNIGKKNQTSIAQQVLKECESEYKEQEQKGYKSLSTLNYQFAGGSSKIENFLNAVLSSSKTGTDDYIKPMKAQKYEPGCMKLPCFAQPKINGVRCTVKLHTISDGLFGEKKEIQLRSKEGLRYEVKHLEEEFAQYIKDDNIVIDGELYIADQPVTSIGGAARNKSNPLNSQLGFIAFDLSIPVLTQEERINELLNIFNNNLIRLGLIRFCDYNKGKLLKTNIFLIPTFEISKEEDIITWRNQFIFYKFEGIILRDKEATYKFGSRAKTMRKYKLKEDAEFQILDIIPGDKDGKPIFVCKNDVNDLTFRVDGTVEYLHPDFIIHKADHIGKLATVEFFERTINQLPFHCTLIGIRDYET